MVNVVVFYIGFKVLSAVTMRSTVFLDVTQYIVIDIYKNLYHEDGESRFLRKV
jgi:hypothetical protein